MSGRILGRILQILGLIGLPTDLKLWYNILSAVVPAAAAGVFAYAQQASLPVLVLLVLGVYVVFFLASIPITAAISRLRASGAADEIRLTEQAQTTIINYGHIQMNSVTGAERGDEPPLGGENVHEEEQLEVHHASELPRPQELPPDLVHEPHLYGESFYITQLIPPGTYGLRRRVFEFCRIHGPALLVPSAEGRVGGKSFVDCTWHADEDHFWEARPDLELIVGALVIEDCLFRECHFVNVGVVVPPEDFERIRENFQRRRRELEEGSHEPQEIEPPDEETTQQ